MEKRPTLAAVAAVVFVSLGVLPSSSPAQTFETLGVRAAGMGGAFVGVADDATAVYWNPAGLASGAFFSLAIDHGGASTEPDLLRAGSRSSTVLALSVPALGLSYYRLRATRIAPAETRAADPGLLLPADVRVESLITHHAGVTVVQSLTDTVAAGATVKLVRGIGTSVVVPDTGRRELLDEAGGLVGAASTRADVDLGLMATLGWVKAGLAMRNAAAPSFDVAGDGDRLGLDRAVRAGVSLAPLRGWILAADVDLTRNASAVGEVRDLAVGAEAHVVRRAALRAGLRLNTLDGEEEPGRRTAFSVGGSYAVW